MGAAPRGQGVMERIPRREFESAAIGPTDARRTSSGAVLLGQGLDGMVIDWATFIAICRHLGVTAEELEGGE